MARKPLKTPTQLYREKGTMPLRCMCGGTWFRIRYCRCADECQDPIAICMACKEEHDVLFMPEQRLTAYVRARA